MNIKLSLSSSLKCQRFSLVFTWALVVSTLFLLSCNNGERYYEYYDNNQVKLSGVIKDGMRQGEWLELFEDGTKKFKLTYIDGKKQGLSIVWYYTGLDSEERILSQGNYLNDLKEGYHQFWYQNGQLKIKGEYKKGKEEGLWCSWYENGEKMTEINFVNGIKQGGMKMWFSNGQIHREGSYENNKLNGVCKVWNESGNFVNHENW